jgi:hypothetical protein
MADANTPFFPDEEKTDEALDTVQESELVSIIKSRFQESAMARRVHEDRMILSYNNYRGIYGKNEPFRKSEKSRVFVKITKTKVLAGYGQLAEIVLSGEKFPIGIKATEVPEGVDDTAHVGVPAADPSTPMVPEEVANPFDVGFKGDGNELPVGATFGSKLRKMFAAPAPEEDLIVAGVAPTPEQETFNPAKNAAERLEKLIHDQLGESNAVSELGNALFESALTGTGIVKGPFTYTKTLHQWSLDEATGKRVYKPTNTKVPRIEFVSVWDAYPDPNATTKEELSYFIHRHRLNDSQMRALNRMPYFNKEEITRCLSDGPNYTKQSYESSINPSDEEGTGKSFSDRFEVLEYWGTMGVPEARDVGLSVEGMEDLDEVQINAWVCGGNVLRIVTNPFTPARIPYHIFNYEKNPYSLFGIGIPENMSDSQQIMNGHARMAIDNLALAGGLVFDVDETALVPGQDLEIYNGKVFYRQAGSVGQSVYGVKFPNTANENLAMFDKFRQLSDEETGIPSFSHGQTGVQSMTRTASGMSMLMGAASLNIKTVIKNIDNQLLKPLGEDLFQWNMQFFEGDLDIQGDLEVKAMGTNSLMQKEVRSQRLNMFLQTVLNPTLAPFVKIPYIVEELAKSMDLNPKDVLNSTQEARIAAQIIGLQNASTQGAGSAAGPTNQESAGMGGVQGVPQAGGNPGPTGTGDGNIGTGIVPQSGEDEFSG